MLDDTTKEQVLKVLETNEKIHSAFFKYDGKKVEESAKALQSSIEGIKNKEVAKLLKFSKDKLMK